MGIDDVVSRACCDARNIEHTGQKVDREAMVTLVLPQLWTVHVSFSLNIRRLPLILSSCVVLNIDLFTRLMCVSYTYFSAVINAIVTSLQYEQHPRRASRA